MKSVRFVFQPLLQVLGCRCVYRLNLATTFRDVLTTMLSNLNGLFIKGLCLAPAAIIYRYRLQYLIFHHRVFIIESYVVYYCINKTSTLFTEPHSSCGTFVIMTLLLDSILNFMVSHTGHKIFIFNVWVDIILIKYCPKQ